MVNANAVEKLVGHLTENCNIEGGHTSLFSQAMSPAWNARHLAIRPRGTNLLLKKLAKEAGFNVVVRGERNYLEPAHATPEAERELKDRLLVWATGKLHGEAKARLEKNLKTR